MRIGYYAAALGSLEQEKRLDVIANNLSNAGTAGFKKDAVHFKDFLDQTTYSRMSPGRVRQTDNPMDVALNGEGYLRVQSDQGILFTRAGNLTRNKEDSLVTQEGWPVLGKNGGPIKVETSNIRIEQDGQVFDDGDSVDTLDIVKFPANTLLEKARNGLFKPPQGIAPIPATECSVQQGALEDANFDMVSEMTQMIETMRVFEAYQKTLQFHDQLDSQITSKLGNI
jgi:flagellar basal-body rod protein FlgF